MTHLFVISLTWLLTFNETSFASETPSAAVLNICKTEHYANVFDPLPLEFYSDSCPLKGKEKSFRKIIESTYDLGVELGSCNYFIPEIQATVEANDVFGFPGPGFKKMSDRLITCDNSTQQKRQHIIDKFLECYNRAAMLKLLDQAKICGEKSFLIQGLQKYQDMYYNLCLIKKKNKDQCKTISSAALVKYKNNFSTEEKMLDFNAVKHFENTIDSLVNRPSDCANGNALDCYNKAVEKIKEKQTPEAFKLFEKGCDGNYFSACYMLGIGELSMSHNGKARKLFIKSCDGDDYDGCYQLGLLDKKSGNKKAATINFEKACAGSLQLACDETPKK